MNTQVVSKKLNSRDLMERATTFLSRCETNEGLDPKEVQLALTTIGNWKRGLVAFLIGKPNFKDGNKPHTHESASACADAIFTRFYEDEKNARLEPIPTRWHSREAGELEFGGSDIATDYFSDEVFPGDVVADMDSKEEVKFDYQERRERMVELMDALKSTHLRGQVLARANNLYKIGVIWGKDVRVLRLLASKLAR